MTEKRKSEIPYFMLHNQIASWFAATIRNECNKAGVTFYTKGGQYDLNNPSDIFTRQILDATSQLENALLHIV